MRLQKDIALTFEAGGDPEICRAMLAVLQHANTTATVFLEGRWSEKHPHLVQQIAGDGHELGNHSYSHPNFTQLGDAQIKDELHQTHTIIKQITGITPPKWLRPPYGAVDDRVKNVVRAEGYRLVQRHAMDGGHWNLVTTPERIAERALENAFPSAVFAFHLNNSKTLAVLPDVIQKLRDQGYRFVRLSDLAEVSELPERHADFADATIASGYLQALKPRSRVWSMNVAEFGARLTHPTNQPVTIIHNDNRKIDVISGDALPDWLPAVSHDRYIMSIMGCVECHFRAGDADYEYAYALACPNDLILWAKNALVRLSSSQRWIVLIFD